jgi:CelD/BcsL family acetyltransferase involved in cellulose biosynthesis
MRDLGTPVYSRRLFEETLRAFPDRASVFVVRQSGVACAAGVSVRFRDVVLVPWASSLREYRALCPNMLLYWTMLEHAVSNGATTFDFGRSSPGSGTHAFKVQWGASATPLHWEYALLTARAVPDQGPSNSRFRTAIGLWKHLPQWVANSMGPALASHLP